MLYTKENGPRCACTEAWPAPPPIKLSLLLTFSPPGLAECPLGSAREEIIGRKRTLCTVTNLWHRGNEANKAETCKFPWFGNMKWACGRVMFHKFGIWTSLWGCHTESTQKKKKNWAHCVKGTKVEMHSGEYVLLCIRDINTQMRR